MSANSRPRAWTPSMMRLVCFGDGFLLPLIYYQKALIHPNTRGKCLRIDNFIKLEKTLNFQFELDLVNGIRESILLEC